MSKHRTQRQVDIPPRSHLRDGWHNRSIAIEKTWRFPRNFLPISNIEESGTLFAKNPEYWRTDLCYRSSEGSALKDHAWRIVEFIFTSANGKRGSSCDSRRASPLAAFSCATFLGKRRDDNYPPGMPRFAYYAVEWVASFEPRAEIKTRFMLLDRLSLARPLRVLIFPVSQHGANFLPKLLLKQIANNATRSPFPVLLDPRSEQFARN